MVRSSRAKPLKGKQKREEVKKQVSELLGKGDIEGLDGLLSELDTIRDSEAALESLRDTGLRSYGEFVHKFLGSSPKSKNSPIILFHLIHELFLRSLIADYAQAEKIFERHSLHTYLASMKEAAEDIQSGEASFSKSERVAKSLFTNLFENYKKLCMRFADHAANANGEKLENANDWRKYLSNSEPDYGRLLPEEVDAFIRNAISHRDIKRISDDKYKLSDRTGKSKVYTARFLDRRLGLLWTRIVAADFALSLAGLFSNQMLIVALHQRRRRK